MNFLFNESWKKVFNRLIIIRNQNIRMISEGLCDTEDWSNDAENTASITEINYISKYIEVENSYLNNVIISLFILIFIKSSVDCIAHFILFHSTFYSFFFFLYPTLTYIYIYSLVLCFIFYFIFLHCPLSGPVLTFISLLIIPCMIVYVTNNKEPWTLNLEYFKILPLYCIYD